MSGSIIPCPHCGADIREDAKFCRHCGSSEADGWREDDDEGYGEDELDDFDYEGFVEENFGDTVANTQTPAIWRLVSVVLLMIFAFGVLFLFF